MRAVVEAVMPVGDELMCSVVPLGDTIHQVPRVSLWCRCMPRVMRPQVLGLYTCNSPTVSRSVSARTSASISGLAFTRAANFFMCAFRPITCPLIAEFQDPSLPD
jgi:hypothetical protein